MRRIRVIGGMLSLGGMMLAVNECSWPLFGDVCCFSVCL
jgi:hypothetical protein